MCFTGYQTKFIYSIRWYLLSLPFKKEIKKNRLEKKKKIIFKDEQVKLFFKLTLISILVLFIYLIIVNKSIFEIHLRSVIFNVVSILTGTGYVTKEFDQWGNFPLIFFLILMFIGGCAGSTTCGIKIFRVHILYYFIRNENK